MMEKYFLNYHKFGPPKKVSIHLIEPANSECARVKLQAVNSRYYLKNITEKGAKILTY